MKLERQLQEFIEERRPPEEIREEVDLGYSYQNNTVEIFEIRPQWNDRTLSRNLAAQSMLSYILIKKQ